MRLFPVAFAVAAVAAAACSNSPHATPDSAGSHDSRPAADAPPGSLLARLQALPGVTAMPSQSATDGYEAFELEFTQPVDHDDPQSATFQQEATLMVVSDENLALPFIIATSGYSDFIGSTAAEPTQLVGGNQISIEHRFFATSRPSPADWTKDTVEQMADDEHAIVTLLSPILTGPRVSTGASKGGMTALFYRRFFPGDVAGTVAYVAPISFGSADTRYDPQFDTVGPADGTCRTAVKAAAQEMLQNRRAALLTRAQTEANTNGFVYTRVPIAVSLEGAIESLEWAFWQYYGVQSCSSVPATTATDDAMFAFLDNISPVSGTDDAYCDFFDAYYFQAAFQLGQPDPTVPYLTAFEQFGGSDFDGLLPADSNPVYDNGSAMDDQQTYVETQGADLIFVYGQWDPWTGGAWSIGSASDTQLSIAPEGTHGSGIADLAAQDKLDASNRLMAWTGVPLIRPDVVRPTAPPRLPRLPRAVRPRL